MKLTRLLIYFLFVTLALGQFQRLGIFYLHDLIILVLLILNFKIIRLSRAVCLFLGAGLLSLAFNPLNLSLVELGSSGLYLIRFAAYACLLPIFKAASVKPLLLLKILILVLAGFGWLQYLFLPDTRWLTASNWDDHYFRALSTLLDPNYFGGLLVLGLVIFKLKLWPSLFLLSVLFLTYSRSSYLSLVSVILAFVILKKKIKFLLLLLVFLLLPFLPRPGGDGVKLERVFSVTQRLDNYQAGIKLWQEYPVFGVGFNTLRYWRGDFTSHAAAGFDSSLIFVLATTGVVGLLAYFNLLKWLWHKSDLMKLTLVALLVHSLFVNSLFYPWQLIFLWSVADS